MPACLPTRPSGHACPPSCCLLLLLLSLQVYAASIMFGYFLRRVDTRFQLAKQLDVLPPSRDDAVARLERLFAQVGGSATSVVVVMALRGGVCCGSGLACCRLFIQNPSAHALEQRSSPILQLPCPSASSLPPPCCLQADEIDPSSDPDAAPPLDPTAAATTSQQPEASTSQQQQEQQPETGLVAKQKSALRRYVESFDQETMLETARCVGGLSCVCGRSVECKGSSREGSAGRGWSISGCWLGGWALARLVCVICPTPGRCLLPHTPTLLPCPAPTLSPAGW